MGQINGVAYLTNPKLNENVALSKTATEINGAINALIDSFKPIVGNDYMGIGKVGNFGSSSALVADTLYAVPFVNPVTVTVNGWVMTHDVTDNGKFIRGGIYNAANGLPTSLLADFGAAPYSAIITLGAGAAARNVGTLGANLQIAPGFYFLAFISNSSTVKIGRLTNYLWATDGWGQDTTAYNRMGGYSKAAVGYGALPATFPASPTSATSAMHFFMPLVVASVP